MVWCAMALLHVQVVVAGASGADDSAQLLAAAQAAYKPDKVRSAPRQTHMHTPNAHAKLMCACMHVCAHWLMRVRGCALQASPFLPAC